MTVLLLLMLVAAYLPLSAYLDEWSADGGDAPRPHLHPAKLYGRHAFAGVMFGTLSEMVFTAGLLRSKGSFFMAAAALPFLAGMSAIVIGRLWPKRYGGQPEFTRFACAFVGVLALLGARWAFVG
jgi:hypothetical protein